MPINGIGNLEPMKRFLLKEAGLDSGVCELIEKTYGRVILC
jgi:hypothetical protein